MADFFDFRHPEKNQFKRCGTPGYIAPEIYKSKKYDQKVDVYSAGIIFYILVYGKHPFETNDQDQLIKMNEKSEINFNREYILNN